MECLFKDGTNKFGTGFLSGNNFALTSAHVVFDGELGLATHIKCHISRHGSNKLKTVLVSQYVYPKSYESTYRKIVSQKVKGEDINQKEAEELATYDYALLVFDANDQSITNATPVFSTHYYTEPTNDLIFCGYLGTEYDNSDPERKQHSKAPYPYEVKAKFTLQKQDVMIFKTPSYSGMSGGPVRFKVFSNDNNEIWYTTAILSEGTSVLENRKDRTLGCRLTEKKLRHIEDWKITLSSIKDLECTLPGCDGVFKTLETSPFVQLGNTASNFISTAENIIDEGKNNYKTQ